MDIIIRERDRTTANLHTKILNFRGFELKHNLKFKGSNSHACRTLPGKFESTNLGRDKLRRGTGRNHGRHASKFAPVVFVSATSTGHMGHMGHMGHTGQVTRATRATRTTRATRARAHGRLDSNWAPWPTKVLPASCRPACLPSPPAGPPWQNHGYCLCFACGRSGCLVTRFLRLRCATRPVDKSYRENVLWQCPEEIL